MELKSAIAKCAEQYDSFYIYDESGIINNITILKSHFPGIDFLYSIKCNAAPNVLRCIFGQGFGADAASLGEVMAASDMGLSPDRIYFSAPGKTLRDIEMAMTKATLIADSLDEIVRIQHAAEKANAPIKIGLRINPSFSFADDHGHPSKFGIDEDQALRFLKENKSASIQVNGIHVHLKSQELRADILASYYDKFFRLAERMSDVCGELDYVNMGSGMGVAYAKDDRPLDLARLASLLRENSERFRARFPKTRQIIEVGRFVVCKNGFYVTKVLDRKVSYGKTYIILKNTLNGFLRPSLARLVSRYTIEPHTSAEPLFTGLDAFQFLALPDEGPQETVTLTGNLCTAADVIAEDILMPHLTCGDCVVITNAGGYAAVLSPMQFSAQERPTELFLAQDGTIKL